jgi:hypothetical protein
VLTIWADYLRDQGFASTKDSTEISVYDRTVLGPVSIGDDLNSPPIARGFHLEQNYPNPFNPHTTISFELSRASNLSLNIYDLKGRLVRSLGSGKMWNEGTHRVNWDGRDDRGQEVGTGVYLYKLATMEGVSGTKKMILLK